MTTQRQGPLMRVRPPLVLGAGACALAAIVTSSLDRDAYFYYRHQPRPPWEYATGLALLALVPWGMALSEWVIHAPGFWLLHLLWLWLVTATIGVVAVLSLVSTGYRAFRVRGSGAERAVS